MKEIDESANGSSAKLAPGEELVVALRENPSTGYRWSATVEPASLVSVDSSKFRAHGSSPGRGGERLLRVTALAPGSARLECKLWRAWEGEGSVERRFALSLVVS
jgi:inhibitor of cysteine peptidase